MRTNATDDIADRKRQDAKSTALKGRVKGSGDAALRRRDLPASSSVGELVPLTLNVSVPQKELSHVLLY